MQQRECFLQAARRYESRRHRQPRIRGTHKAIHRQAKSAIRERILKQTVARPCKHPPPPPPPTCHQHDSKPSYSNPPTPPTSRRPPLRLQKPILRTIEAGTAAPPPSNSRPSPSCWPPPPSHFALLPLLLLPRAVPSRSPSAYSARLAAYSACETGRLRGCGADGVLAGGRKKMADRTAWLIDGGRMDRCSVVGRKESKSSATRI
ncbi:uncharacterized protein K452DRAFT_54640 [Aplosporella prunicola CBS 121167]|uniref:Uncharacterized protein n=1 Tax=Aplosporella prunicola CBS 121167 TaxID=1176127 RepID=A0A6A6B9W1_9PEZI|nr:uncharacterized protein K452DRAFT_54640 [Aplosporella prunicola CBS 121167]KAF2140358.1 hypothetical protein K452DRAFT_54640 [Aplosporella prunicola CBS 121167]